MRLYFMDDSEIDAALDFRNVSIVANYIINKDRTKNAQFIIISLRFVGPLFNAAQDTLKLFLI